MRSTQNWFRMNTFKILFQFRQKKYAIWPYTLHAEYSIRIYIFGFSLSFIFIRTRRSCDRFPFVIYWNSVRELLRHSKNRMACVNLYEKLCKTEWMWKRNRKNEIEWARKKSHLRPLPPPPIHPKSTGKYFPWFFPISFSLYALFLWFHFISCSRCLYYTIRERIPPKFRLIFRSSFVWAQKRTHTHTHSIAIKHFRLSCSRFAVIQWCYTSVVWHWCAFILFPWFF